MSSGEEGCVEMAELMTRLKAAFRQLSFPQTRRALIGCGECRRVACRRLGSELAPHVMLELQKVAANIQSRKLPRSRPASCMRTPQSLGLSLPSSLQSQKAGRFRRVSAIFFCHSRVFVAAFLVGQGTALRTGAFFKKDLVDAYSKLSTPLSTDANDDYLNFRVLCPRPGALL